MTTQLQAVYVNGELRPLQPLDHAERAGVTITVTDGTADAAASMDQAKCGLSAKQWDAFLALLNGPLREIPELRRSHLCNG